MEEREEMKFISWNVNGLRACVKKGFLKNLYGVLSTSFLVAVLSVTLSVPLNYLYCDGSTQNIWGDGVIESMEKVGFLSLIHISEPTRPY